VREQIKKLPEGHKDLRKVASIVANKAIQKDKVKDNVTLIVVGLKKSKK